MESKEQGEALHYFHKFLRLNAGFSKMTFAFSEIFFIS